MTILYIKHSFLACVRWLYFFFARQFKLSAGCNSGLHHTPDSQIQARVILFIQISLFCCRMILHTDDDTFFYNLNFQNDYSSRSTMTCTINSQRLLRWTCQQVYHTCSQNIILLYLYNISNYSKCTQHNYIFSLYIGLPVHINVNV